MKNLVKLLGLIAIIAIAGFSFTACDNGAFGGGGQQQPPGGGGETGGSLVLPSGYIWWSASGESLVFEAGGSMMYYGIHDCCGYMHLEDFGFWSVTGSILTINFIDGWSQSWTFHQPSRNELVLSDLYGAWRLVRRSIASIGGHFNPCRCWGW